MSSCWETEIFLRNSKIFNITQSDRMQKKKLLQQQLFSEILQ
jgi:hypothetical protein